MPRRADPPSRRWWALPWRTLAGWGLAVIMSGRGAAAADALRDPFTFGVHDETVQRPSTMLIGILWDATHPLAINGEQTVGVGETVSGWRVVRIEQGSVTIQRDTRREALAPGQALPE